MPMDDPDRITLEEIERELTRDHPEFARHFRRVYRVGREVALPILGAAAVFLIALTVLSVETGSAIPVLLALPPVAVALLLLRWPWLFAMVPAEPGPSRRRRHDES